MILPDWISIDTGTGAIDLVNTFSVELLEDVISVAMLDDTITVEVADDLFSVEVL